MGTRIWGKLNVGLGNFRETWIINPALLLSTYKTLGMSFKISEPHFSHLPSKRETLEGLWFLNAPIL